MDIKSVVGKVDEVLADYSMPKRVKVVLLQIRSDLMRDNKDKDVVITTAIYALDEITNDVNIQMHAKTVIWDIISELEALKK